MDAIARKMKVKVLGNLKTWDLGSGASARGAGSRKGRRRTLRERLELRAQRALDARSARPVLAQLLVLEGADEVPRELLGREAVGALR